MLLAERVGRTFWLDTIFGIDPHDAATGDQAGHAFTDYTQFLNDKALVGARIGVWRAGTYDPALVGSVVEPILNNTIAALKAQDFGIELKFGNYRG